MMAKREANENPYYILATAYGEPSDPSDASAISNKALWNYLAGRFRPDQDKLLFRHPTSGGENFIEFAVDALKKRWPDATEEKSRNVVLNLHNHADFSNTKFAKRLDLGKLVMPKICKFSRSVFEKGLELSESDVFETEFRNVKLEWQVNCVDTNFFEGLHFSATNFDTIIFSGARFKKRFSLVECKAKRMHFPMAKFESDIALVQTEILEGFYFSAVDVAGRFYTDDTIFSSKSPNAASDFSGSNFDQGLDLRGARFANNYPDFSGVKFPEKPLFSFTKNAWPKLDEFPESAKASCGAIRHALAKQGMPEEEHFFYRREMFYAGRTGSVAQKIPYRIFEFFSDFGHSIKRPSYALLFLWALGFAPFCGYFASIHFDRPFGTAFSLSFSNVFQVFGFGRLYFDETIKNLPTVLKVVSALQTVLSVPLLFLLALGIRTRFRMR